MTSWQTAAGELLKGELPLGMAMYTEPKDVAQKLTTKPPRFAVIGHSAVASSASSYVPPKDFAQATAVAINRPIDNPREVASLAVTLSGIDDPKLILSDARQRAERLSAGENRWRMTIRAGRFDADRSVSLPVSEPSVQSQLTRAPYLETDDPKIAKLAAELRGQETNAYKVAMKVRDWVHKSMTPDYSIGVPRSCVEVNGKRRGVCRDYATLFAGIARAAGVPTRVCGGMLFADGKFFYHAWAECWVGEWTPFDPTLPQGDFVDATHIKFAQGDVTDMFQVAGIVGRIKVTVDSVN